MTIRLFPPIIEGMPSFSQTFVNSPKMGRTYVSGGSTLHYYEDGAGQPLIFLHGFGFSLFTFRNSIPVLSQSMRVIALDLPGCGYSTLGAECDGSIASVANILRDFIIDNALEHGILCGIAEGAMYALQLATENPDLISALALISPGSLTRHYPWTYKLLNIPKMGEWLMNSMTPRSVAQLLSWAVFNETQLDSYTVRQTYMPFEDQRTRSALLKLIRAYDDRALFDRLRYVRCPVLLMWGENDAVHPAYMATVFTRSLPRFRSFLFPNCGHLVQEDKPQDFNKLLSDFVREVKPPVYTDALFDLETAEDYT